MLASEAAKDAAKSMLVNTDVNVLEFCKSLGYNVYSHVGKLSFPELELSYISACFRRRFFDDNKYMRARRHSLLYWRRGFFKTSIITRFVRDCSPAEDVSKHRKDAAAPCYVSLTGRYSTEFLTGGAAGKRIILPLVNEVNFVIAGELMNFLMESPEVFANRVDWLNPILEEGEGTVGLIKMASIDKEELTAMYGNDLWQRKIVVDLKRHTMTYPVSAVALFASRPVSSTQAEFLDGSGFFDRFSLVKWHKYEEEWKDVWLHFANIDETASSTEDSELILKELNTILWSTKLNILNAPPADILKTLFIRLDKHYQQLSSDLELNLDKLYSARDSTNLSIMLACSAFLNLYKSYGFVEDLVYPRLKYSSKDVDFVLDYLLNYAMMRATDNSFRLSSYESFLVSKYYTAKEEFPINTEINLRSLVDHFTARYKIANRTAYSWVRKLERRGYVSKNNSTATTVKVKLLK